MGFNLYVYGLESAIINHRARGSISAKAYKMCSLSRSEKIGLPGNNMHSNQVGIEALFRGPKQIVKKIKLEPTYLMTTGKTTY